MRLFWPFLLLSGSWCIPCLLALWKFPRCAPRRSPGIPSPACRSSGSLPISGSLLRFLCPALAHYTIGLLTFCLRCPAHIFERLATIHCLRRCRLKLCSLTTFFRTLPWRRCNWAATRKWLHHSVWRCQSRPSRRSFWGTCRSTSCT
jgi:hypothetical protein